MTKRTIQIAMMLAAVVLFSASLMADQIKIKSNPHCGACKEKIEKGLSKVPGVENSNVDVDSKIVTVNYDAEKTNPEQLMKAVSDLGFTAAMVKDGNMSSGKKDCCTTKSKKHSCDVDKKKEMKKSCCTTKKHNSKNDTNTK